MLAAVRRRKEAAIALDEAGEYEVAVSSSLAEGARDDWSRCLAFVQGEETTRAEGLDGHVHGFLDSAWQLQHRRDGDRKRGGLRNRFAEEAIGPAGRRRAVRRESHAKVGM